MYVYETLYEDSIIWRLNEYRLQPVYEEKNFTTSKTNIG